MPDAGTAHFQVSRHDRVMRACEKWWPLVGPHALPNCSDCSGFVISVARDLGVTLAGRANDIFAAIQRKPWSVLGAGDAAAQTAAIAATNGFFVVAAWKSPNRSSGHVAVIVDTNQNHKTRAFQGRARAYWGTLGDVGEKYGMHTSSFGEKKLPSVIYAAHEISTS